MKIKNMKFIKIKNRRGSSGMGPNQLIPDYNNYSKNKYLNVSIHSKKSRTGMAEWSTQSVDTRCPSGCVGSIPTPSATISNKILMENIK